MVKSGTVLEFSTQEFKRIARVELGILNAEEIKALSVCEINEVNYIDKTLRQPKENGLSDPRMGPCLKGIRCKTCDGDLNNCPGHFGHMVMAKPVYHFGFVDMVKKVLSCVCYKCSRLKLPEQKKDNTTLKKIEQICKIKAPLKRLNELYKVLKGIKKCYGKKLTENEAEQMLEEDKEDGFSKKEGGCDAVQPNYKELKEEIGIQRVFLDKTADILDTKMYLSAEDALKILEKMTDEDCAKMGFEHKHTRPEHMIITVLPVAPPPVRPTVERAGGATSEDDLTYQYIQILKSNLNLKRAVETGEATHSINDKIKPLQFLVTTLVKNEYAKKSTHKNGRPIKSIRARISGKEGRIRGNLMGKRVDFSARTVISPDPNLQLDQLGVPRSVAGNLTFPETVTKLNKDQLEALVRKDTPWTWPGAKYVIKKNGESYDLRYAKEINLEYGDVVERHIIDGDYVLFNRQPSLHKMSMMAHRIRVLPYSSFRLNLSVTKPYNADFDGDEMNMHVPQTYETKAELKEIMHVPKQIVAPKANQPVMGIEQDSLVGIRLFTRREIFLELDQVMQLMMHLPLDLFEGKIPEPAILKPKKLWTGKQIISLILPKVNLERISSDFPKDDDAVKKEREEACPMDTMVNIVMGELLTGHVDKNTVGSAGGGLVHVIWLEFGSERAKGFLSDAQRVVNNWLAWNAFTVGISDMIATQATLDKIEQILITSVQKVDKIWEDALTEDKLEHQKGKSIMDSFEACVNQELNGARDSCGKELQQNIGASNNVLRMVNAGSKGSLINLCQIIACVGQQNVEGKRIPFGFVKRSLPHFKKHDYSPAAKGFVYNCYVKGLTASEFFFHTMGGREGLIDTACKTSETGYIQRKLVKAIEDVMVKYDGTVRDSRGTIVQFLYGEDGMAGEYIEAQVVDIIKKSNDDLDNEFKIKNMTLLTDSMDEDMHREELREIKAGRDELRTVFEGFEVKQYLPVNVPRIIQHAKSQFKITPKTESDLGVSEVIGMVNDLVEKGLIIVPGEDQISKDSQNNATTFIRHYLRYMLSSKKTIVYHKLTREAFKWVVGQIQYCFQRARSHPGEMVGAIAAQSISEPTTQMTLNTFHNAGVSSKNVTLGVPRVKEILNRATNIKTPSMYIYLKEEYRDEESLRRFLQTTEHTTLRKLALRSQIFYDPDPENTIVSDTNISYVKEFFEMPEDDLDVSRLSPWLLRITLDAKQLIDPILFETLIKKNFKDTFSRGALDLLMISNGFALAMGRNEDPEIRIILKRPNETGLDDEAERLKKIEKDILEMAVSGIPNVKKVYTRLNPSKLVDPITGKLDEKQKETSFETDGTNLKGVFALESVDHRRTITNDIVEINRVLGIEAARKFLLNEIRGVFRGYDIYVNYRHLGVLCDAMCCRGYIMPINRNGINRVDVGPLRKCSFEETLDMLLEAAVFSQSDPLTGISENVMLGQLCRLGTGYFDLVMDYTKFREPKYIPDPTVDIPSGGGMELIMNTSNPMDTPIAMGTPGPYGGNATPTPGRTGAYDYLDAMFTPGPVANMASPMYTPRPLESPGGVGGGNYPFSPGYIPASPRPQEVGGGGWSSLHYNPTSPHYSASNSPSMSSSAGSNKNYSPMSPTYSITSPKYSPSYSPRSPGYTSAHSSNTPSSAHPMGTQQYTPTSPGYKSGMYNPVSPAYEKAIQNQAIEEGEESQEEDEDDEVKPNNNK
jgi:DNA-directed RNA polymerase II subunit RPB1